MAYQIRTLKDDEWEAYFRATEAAFADAPDDQEGALWRQALDQSRCLAAFDGDAIVGGAASFAQELTVPGGLLRTAGVTYVSVVPTHRRRGILTLMMRRQLDEVHEWGEPLAALWAMEAVIYGRFGYGLATQAQTVTAPRSRGLLPPPPGQQGDVRMIPWESAAEPFARVYDAVRASRPGMVSRDPAFWRLRLFDSAERRRGQSPTMCALHDGADGPEGYVKYRVKYAEDSDTAGRVKVSELVWSSEQSYRALWRFVLDLDLTHSLVAHNRPVDELLPWMIADPRRLELCQSEGLWVRLVDVPAALSGRRYAADGGLVLDVRDDFCPWNTGRFELTGGSDGAQCVSSTKSADISISISDLGSAYLSGVRLVTLQAAGLVEEHSRGAVARADAMFGWSVPPWCPGVF